MGEAKKVESLWFSPSIFPPTVFPRKAAKPNEARLFRMKLKGELLESLVTTLLDPVTYPLVKLAQLYHDRWECELNLRDLKTSMQMEILGGKTPQMVRKEVYAHILAYNLLRSLMWNAATTFINCPHYDSASRALSSTCRYLHLSYPLHHHLLLNPYPLIFYEPGSALADTLPNRPNRIEPRRKKRRPKSYGWLQQSRDELRDRLKKELAA